MANLHCIGISINREAVKKHQGKVGVVCGLSLAGAYQGYASHVLECPGELSISMKCVQKTVGLLLFDSVTGRKRFVALSPDQIKKISRWPLVSSHSYRIFGN